jgi:eukaryotic-like serine/threonine-protein kinase
MPGGQGGYEGPAGRLVGQELEGGWVVKERLKRSPDATGGLYSIGYVVEGKDGERAFMKAHDYVRALRTEPANVSRILGNMFAAHNFERDLNERLAGRRLSRVVQVLRAGAISVPGAEIPVNYLIFELADGDIRHSLDRDDAASDIAWKLRVSHQVATGLSQLHRQGVAHQDLKPSNAMDFGAAGAKIGDLGSAWYRGQTSPMVDEEFAGDPDYAPPECLFGYQAPDEGARLKARDLYMFGSLLLFLFRGIDATGALLYKLPREHHPGVSGATFQQALPHLIEATDRVAEEFAEHIEAPLAELPARYRELCEPDPERRGHPKARTVYGDPYSLERYISRLDDLATQAEAEHRRAA